MNTRCAESPSPVELVNVQDLRVQALHQPLPTHKAPFLCLKCELLHGHRFLDREAARTAVFDYIEGFYNRVRRHSSLGYLSPSEYEQATIKEVAIASGE